METMLDAIRRLRSAGFLYADPTTRNLTEKRLAVEEEHADDLASLIGAPGAETARG